MTKQAKLRKNLSLILDAMTKEAAKATPLDNLLKKIVNLRPTQQFRRSESGQAGFRALLRAKKDINLGNLNRPGVSNIGARKPGESSDFLDKAVQSFSDSNLAGLKESVRIMPNQQLAAQAAIVMRRLLRSSRAKDITRAGMLGTGGLTTLSLAQQLRKGKGSDYNLADDSSADLAADISPPDAFKSDDSSFFNDFVNKMKTDRRYQVGAGVGAGGVALAALLNRKRKRNDEEDDD